MRRSNPAYPAVGESGRTQTDDNLSDVTHVSMAGRPGMDASRPDI